MEAQTVPCLPLTAKWFPRLGWKMFTMAFQILACPGLQSTNVPQIRQAQETLPELFNIHDQRVAFLETIKAHR